MWLAKSFLLFHFALDEDNSIFFWSLSPWHISSATFSPSPHLFLLNFFSPPHPPPSQQDGHLIHLTSWKDKYSLVEYEAPASSLTQTGDEEKVSLCKAQMPKCLYKDLHSNRCRPEDDSNNYRLTLRLFFFFLQNRLMQWLSCSSRGLVVQKTWIKILFIVKVNTTIF